MKRRLDGESIAEQPAVSFPIKENNTSLQDYLNSQTTTLKTNPWVPKLILETNTNYKTNALFPDIDCKTEPGFSAKRTDKFKIRGKHIIYSIKNLPTLIEKMRTHKEFNKQNELEIRYLLTCDNKLFFAEEGMASTKIPGHEHMTENGINKSSCKTAGNLKINDEGKIYFISHESGAFLPSWNSLAWACAALFSNDAVFADQIIMQQQEITGESAYLQVDTHALKTEITLKFSQEQCQAFKKANQNQENINPLAKINNPNFSTMFSPVKKTGYQETLERMSPNKSYLLDAKKDEEIEPYAKFDKSSFFSPVKKKTKYQETLEKRSPNKSYLLDAKKDDGMELLGGSKFALISRHSSS
jgi:hypothetical protein